MTASNPSCPLMLSCPLNHDTVQKSRKVFLVSECIPILIKGEMGVALLWQAQAAGGPSKR